ncbi:hypothetical protein F2P81_024832 [Scophthalmus maximus]|uniref:Uncharacterized protein n=1 Tax=Scophthalmus maximus TaxID=52904 RepID=A0A6A4RUK8_SCOMX|nr:hypothetical protein F2P81_024832 [Scophthalmus maximus]
MSCGWSSRHQVSSCSSEASQPHSDSVSFTSSGTETEQRVSPHHLVHSCFTHDFVENKLVPVAPSAADPPDCSTNTSLTDEMTERWLITETAVIESCWCKSLDII